MNQEIETNEDIDTAHKIKLFIQEHGKLGIALVDYHGECIDCCQEALDYHYHGEHGSELAFATEYYNEQHFYGVPENLWHSVDYKAFCDSIFIDDFHSIEINCIYHVFRCF